MNNDRDFEDLVIKVNDVVQSCSCLEHLIPCITYCKLAVFTGKLDSYSISYVVYLKYIELRNKMDLPGEHIDSNGIFRIADNLVDNKSLKDSESDLINRITCKLIELTNPYNFVKNQHLIQPSF